MSNILNSIYQILSSAHQRLEMEDDEKKNEFPGDFVPEIRIVWETCGKSEKVKGMSLLS